MLFHFTTFNHCPQGKIILEDITRIMGAQLEELGHSARCTQDREFTHAVNGWNVVIESFADDPETIRSIAEAHAQGCRFIYLATEEPTEKGFNHGLDPAMVDRQNAFAEAARFAGAILHLVPGEHVGAWYRQFCQTDYAELGYAPSLIDAEEEGEPDFDFGFFGKMTWRREMILTRIESLTGKGVLKLTDFWTPRAERDAIMRRARIILQIRANLEVELVSSTRCASSLHFGRPVIAEPHGLAQPWDSVVHFAPCLESFYEDAMSARRMWRELHRQQIEKLRSVLPAERCIGEPLRRLEILR